MPVLQPPAQPSRRPLGFAAAVAGAVLALAAPSEAAPPGGRVRPERARPGELFAVELPAGYDEVTARFLDAPLPLFADGKGGQIGYGAVPVDAAPGPSPVTLSWARGDTKAEATLAFAIAPREFAKSTLRVARRFTQPSKEQRRRSQADRAAFRRAYAVDFGPPLFRSEFTPPRPAAINARFGDARVFNGKVQSTHLGLDLDGRVGDPIFAANDGVVRMTRDCFYSGRSVLLSHGAGLFTSYFHLERFAVREGQRVRKGELIGHLGLTGRVTGPHLHLSARLNSVTFDPEALFEFRFFPEGAPQTAEREALQTGR